MTHANAPLTPEGRRRLASLIVDEGWAVRRAAERFQCSPATASRWSRRYRAGLPLTDRSSRPHHSPSRALQHLERRIVNLRFTRRWGPHRIGYHLGVPRSTVGRVLARYRMPLLAHLDQGTGLPVRKPTPVRYEKQTPGELDHVDIKKLGIIPDAAAGASAAAIPLKPAASAWHLIARPVRARPPPGDRRSYTTQSMAAPDWPIPNACPTNARTPLPGSGSAQTRSSPSTASSSPQ